MFRRLVAEGSTLGLILNTAKTKAMAFGHRVPPAPVIKNGILLPWVPQLTYLGMLLDTQLTFRPLITSIHIKMTQRVGVMRAMADRSCGAEDRVLRSFYTSAIRACVDYAAPCLISLSPSAIKPLETAQNTALRTPLGAPRWTKCVSLRAEALICRVEERVRQIGASHLAVFLLRVEAAHLAERVSHTFHQDPRLFR